VNGIPKVEDMAVLSEDEYYVIDKRGSIQKFTASELVSDLNMPGCVGIQQAGSSYCWNPEIQSNMVK
jgi:hypothetical protein